MTVGLHISVRAGPTISSANLAIHYDTSDHEEPTRPAPPTTTTTTTETSNATGTTTTAATTTAAPTTAAPTTASLGTNPAPRLYTSSTGTDDDNPITSYQKIIVQQVLQLKTSFFRHSSLYYLILLIIVENFQPVYLFVEAGSYRCSPITDNGGARYNFYSVWIVCVFSKRAHFFTFSLEQATMRLSVLFLTPALQHRWKRNKFILIFYLDIKDIKLIFHLDKNNQHWKHCRRGRQLMWRWTTGTGAVSRCRVVNISHVSPSCGM